MLYLALNQWFITSAVVYSLKIFECPRAHSGNLLTPWSPSMSCLEVQAWVPDFKPQLYTPLERNVARLLQLYLTKSYFKSVCVLCVLCKSGGLSCCFVALLESHFGSHLKQLLLASFIWSLTYANQYLWWCLLPSQVWLSLAVKEVINLSESEVGVLNWIVSKGYVEWSGYVEPQCFELCSSIDNLFCLNWHCLLLSICGTHWSSRASWLKWKLLFSV